MSHLSQMVKKDQRKCFYQYPLSEKSSKESSFLFKGKDGTERKFRWLVLAFGISAATFIVQSINKVLVDYYSLSFNKFALVYIDDYAFEDNEGEFEKLAVEVGLIFNAKKDMRGTKIELLGWELNFEEKTAKITTDKRQKIENMAREMLTTSSVNIENLQSFVGRIGFASRACRLGRLNSFYIERLLAQQQADGNDENLKFVCKLGEHHKQEIRFWLDMKNHQPISFKLEPRFTLEIGAFTDASSKKWAWKLGNKTMAGTFEEDKKNWPIILKEGWALKKLFDDNNFQRLNLEILVDNQPLVLSFNKKFSKNPILHQLIKEMHLKNLKNGNRILLKWIPTSRMAEEGADGASRGQYKLDLDSLSDKGVEKVRKIINLEQDEELFDLFSSPVDNVFRVRYFSEQIDQEDQWSMEEGAFNLLNRLRQEKRELDHVFWAFPPNALLRNFLFSLRQVGVKGRVYLLIDADRTTETAKLVTNFFKFEIIKFSKMRDVRLFRSRPQKARSIFKIEKLLSE